MALLVSLLLLLAITPARAAITFFGGSAQPADNGSYSTNPLEITPPASMATNDYIVMLICGRANSLTWSSAANCDGGQAWTFDTVANSTNRSCTFARAIFNGTWSNDGCGTVNPRFDASSGPNVHSAQMMVFRDVESSSVAAGIDTAKSGAVFASGDLSAGQYTITPGNTTNNGAFVIYCWMSTAVNLWTMTTGGLTQNGARFRNTAGSDVSISCGWKEVTTAGAPGAETNDQTDTGEDDVGIWQSVALKPAAGATTTSSATTTTTGTTLASTRNRLLNN